MPELEARFEAALSASSPEDALDEVANFAWLYYQLTPYSRGSATIGRRLVDSLLKANGIEYQHMTPGVALDLEAFSSTQDEYRRNFPKFLSGMEVER